MATCMKLPSEFGQAVIDINIYKIE